MGRMKRQRKYKACDPFSNAKKDSSKETKYDRAPKNLDDDQVPRKFQRIQMDIQNPMMKKKRKNRKLEEFEKNNDLKKSVKKSKAVNEDKTVMQKLPNETRKQYFERLDQNVQEAINDTMMEAKKLRKKRKEHLKARSEKLKQKKKQPNEKDFKTIEKDHVAFGERVDQPPTITAAPRKSTKNSNNYKDLKLASLIKQKKEPDANDQEKKEALEEERQRVIDAYRLMKKRKEARLNT